MATLEKLENGKVKITIEVPAAKFEEAVEKAYHTNGKKFNVPGFRKGHAPRKMIENAYGPLAFFDDAFDIVYPEVYQAAVKEHDIEVIDRPATGRQGSGVYRRGCRAPRGQAGSV